MYSLNMKRFFSFLTVLAVLFSVFAAGGTETAPITSQNPIVFKTPSAEDSAGAVASVQSSTYSEIDVNLAKLAKLYKMLEENYLWDIDHQAVYEAMATAMFDALGDEYTEYITAEESDEYVEAYFNQYAGIGITFTKRTDNDFCYVEQVFPDAPAAKAGMHPGDKIVQLNGESVDGKTSTECQSVMRGEPGTDVTITIQRNGVTFDVVITRAVVTSPSIDSDYMEEYGIGVIQIISFVNGKTSTDFLNTFNDMLKKGLKALIIDLRGCGGGDVDSALNIANFFISGQPIVSFKYKDSSKDSTLSATKGVAISSKIPVVLLVNEYTASSAELFSGALQDNGRATLIGTTTFGKGIMQALSVPESKEKYKYTFGSFETPAGHTIHKNGITPDIEVKRPVIDEDNTQAYLDLVNSDLISEWVKANPAYTKANVTAFAQAHPDTGLSADIVNLLVSNAYLSEMPVMDQPLLDTWFDPQAIAAVEYLEAKLGRQ